MTKTNKQTVAIWAEKLGDAYVGCYGLWTTLTERMTVRETSIMP